MTSYRGLQTVPPTPNPPAPGDDDVRTISTTANPGPNEDATFPPGDDDVRAFCAARAPVRLEQTTLHRGARGLPQSVARIREAPEVPAADVRRKKLRNATRCGADEGEQAGQGGRFRGRRGKEDGGRCSSCEGGRE